MATSTDISRALAVPRRWALLAAATGVVLCLAGFFLERQRFFESYLLAFVFFTNISLGCLGLLMLHHMTNGKWSFAIQRFAEAGVRTLPLMALLFLPVLFGMSELYPWMHAGRLGETALRKLPYLNQPFFIGRAAFYFALWITMGFLLTRWSRAEDAGAGDEGGGTPRTAALRKLSAPGLILYALTVTFAATDWVMSLEPGWFSSIFGMLFIVNQCLAALALMIVLLRLLSGTPPVSGIVSPGIYHDLGNMLLAFVVLWAYMSFSQLLIIWAGNLPEEITWYVRRLDPGWRMVALVLVVLHFFVPFMLLLLRRSKRSPDILWKIALGLLVMRLVDLAWNMEPAFHPQGIAVHWLDPAALLAVGGLWTAFALRMLKGAPLLALGDPRFRIVAGAPAEGVPHG
jgi:hypothetical protein